MDVNQFLNLDWLQTIVQKVCFIKGEDEVATMLDFYNDLGMIVKHHNTVVYLFFQTRHLSHDSIWSCN